MLTDVFSIPCEKFLTGYGLTFYILCGETIYRGVHEGMAFYCCLPAVKFRVFEVDGYSIFITSEEWENRVFDSIEDAKKFLGNRPKFGKWYRCKDVLPEFGEWVLTKAGTLGDAYYSRRKEGIPSGKPLCGCYDTEWHWEYYTRGGSGQIVRYSPPDDVTHWMPLPTGDEPVEGINS